ncbi:MAG: hypothetical protein K6B52_08935 [Clostridiales bacterium]|nr:hypothetical protein [Clostridiales bacterium]
MKNNRIKIVIISVFAVAASLMTQPSLAFYSTSSIATNVVTAGDINVKIFEKTSGNKDFPQDGVYIMPGSIVSKIVTVKNTGSHPCWLRVKISDQNGRSDILQDVFSIDLNYIDWIDGGDGYYYYSQILRPGRSTEKLFSQVKVAGNSAAVKPESVFELNVIAFAVQSEHNDAVSPLSVAGWPAEESRETA